MECNKLFAEAYQHYKVDPSLSVEENLAANTKMIDEGLKSIKNAKSGSFEEKEANDLMLSLHHARRKIANSSHDFLRFSEGDNYDLQKVLDKYNVKVPENFKFKDIEIEPKRVVEDLDKYIKDNEELKYAIKEYTVGSRGINQDYIKGVRDKELEKLFSVQGNYKGYTYRGTMLPYRQLRELEEGNIITTRMPLSTSKSRDEALNWARGNRRQTRRNQVTPVVIKFSTNKQPAYDISKFSHLPYEEEVLIAPRTNWLIRDVHTFESAYGWITTIDVVPVSNRLVSILGKKKGITNFMSVTGGMILADKVAKKDDY